MAVSKVINQQSVHDAKVVLYYLEDFEETSTAKGEPTKRDLAIIVFLRTYAVPDFRKNKVTDLITKEIARFFDWQRANSRKCKPTRETTILHQTSQISTLLNWSHSGTASTGRSSSKSRRTTASGDPTSTARISQSSRGSFDSG